MTFDIPIIDPISDHRLEAKLRKKIDNKTKPVGSLGRLEDVALQLCLIQKNDVSTFEHPQIVVFAADHGITVEGVSAYPQAVTAQMVANMLGGGAAINVLARQHGFALTVVDAGVAQELDAHPKLVNRKIALGTLNSAKGPAMSSAQMFAALKAGVETVRILPGNVMAFGEMGIGNTSTAALLMHRLTGVPLKDCIGRGTGLDDEGLKTKRKALAAAVQRHEDATDTYAVLAALGGFEIVMMAGAMLQAASERRLILVDGFIASVAALIAQHLAQEVHQYMVYCHRSAERGHKLLLDFMKAKALLNLDLRLGEGTGALLAWPLVRSASQLMNEMASFSSAGVSGKAGD